MRYLKITILSLIVVFLVTCEETDPISDANPKITLSVNSEIVSIGESVTVSAEVMDMPEGILAVSLRILYDPNMLSINDTQGGWIGSSWSSSAIGLLEVDLGIIYLSITQVAGADNVNDGVIFTIDLAPEQAGVASFDLLSSHLVFYDNNGAEISIADLEIDGVNVTIE